MRVASPVETGRGDVAVAGPWLATGEPMPVARVNRSRFARARRFARAGAVLACALLLASGGAARAEEKRPRQEYGHPAPEPDPWAVLAWPLRVLLYPVFLLDEYLVRRPTGALVRAAEAGRWIERVTDFFTFGERKQIVIFPSALFDFGIKPSVGFNAWWKYFLAEKSTLKLHFGTWGPDWIAVRATDTYDLSKTDHLTLSGSYWRRQDNPFFGMGPRSHQGDERRYGAATFDVAPGYRADLGPSSFFEARAGARGLEMYRGTCCEDEDLRDALREGKTSAPGFGDGYVAVFQHTELTLDSRKERPRPGSGVRVAIHEDTTFPLDARSGEARRSWIRYGGETGAAIDLTGRQRVLSLTVAAELVDKLSPGTIPFTDQVSLGGPTLMRGFVRNRLIDRSAAVATLQYTWPVWVYLDGVLTLAAGNVFGSHFDGFDAKLARLSSGIGVRSNGDRDTGFEAMFAVGTEPLDEKFTVNSFRVLVGSHHGF